MLDTQNGSQLPAYCTSHSHTWLNKEQTKKRKRIETMNTIAVDCLDEDRNKNIKYGNASKKNV
jgi:DNA-binding IclR family transcriptional regulator